MKEKLREILSLKPWGPSTANSGMLAAVLVPILLKDAEYHILFTQRTEMVERHRGEVSFPGGAYEEKDITLLDTALRESTEEIGLARKDIEILGELGTTTASSGYLIYPFVGFIPWPYPFKLAERETAEVFTVPVMTLLDKYSFREDVWFRNGRAIPLFYYQYQGKVIWGATARILRQFLGVSAGVMAQERKVSGLPVPPGKPF